VLVNVLFIAIDTLRADRLSCCGHFNHTSPHIDKIAEEGVLFERFFAPHIPTHPGYTTIFTGRDVWNHQVVSQGQEADLDAGIPTLPEIVRQHGHFTAAADNLGRWLRRGYDVYAGYMWERDPHGAWRKAEAVNETAFKVLRECAERQKPWFAFIHYWDPHTPYLPPPPFDRMFYGGDEKDPGNAGMKPVWALEAFNHYFMEWMPGVTDIKFPCAQYDAEIAYCDTAIETLLVHARELGLLRDTLIVVTSDHGEELDEHDLWFDHHGMYDPNLHVPLILWHPDLPKGKRVPAWARHLDIAPTILELMGLGRAAAEAQMEGTSLVPWITGERTDDVAEALYATECTWTRRWCVKTREWHYIESAEPDPFGKPDRELYDLTIDAGQFKNLADDRPDMVKKMHDKLRTHIARREADTGHQDPVETAKITLRQVGDMNLAVPEEQVLHGEDEGGQPDGGWWEDPTSRRLFGMGYL
jgi:arylsulfatase A-like enzyme